MLPTTNVLQRTSLLKDKLVGTAFTIDRDGRQYLVTARHVAEGASGEIYLFHDGNWKTLAVGVVGVGGQDSEDVAVFAPEVQISPNHPLGTNDAGLSLGQQVRFLGFPFGWGHRDFGEINNGWPLPIVKAGILSRMSQPTNRMMLVDAHGNKGFSGGPLVAQISGNWVAIGVVVTAMPNPENLETIDEHAGFVAVEPIRVVTKIIDSNPVGLQLGGA